MKMPSTFEELGLEKELMDSLQEMRIETPTEIQCMGIPAVLQGQSIVMGSHTGSGKTLAYMLPLVQVWSACKTLAFLSGVYYGMLKSVCDLFTSS